MVASADHVPAYAQLLNTSAWTLFACDFDPVVSNPEFVAYLLVHGDRMAILGEVSEAAIRNAAYWFDRSERECRDFAAAARRSSRPDAAAYVALGHALPWLRELGHTQLRPAAVGQRSRSIAGSGVLVPRRLESRPPHLIQQWRAAATRSLESYYARWCAPDVRVNAELCNWLEQRRPPLAVTTADTILFSPQHPDLSALARKLRDASSAAVRHIDHDLRRIAQATDQFHASLVAPQLLPAPHGEMEQRGYVFLHRDLGVIAYNLDEPGMDRLRAPALPYAAPMLAARTIHEWSHLAVDAGWVPQVYEAASLESRIAEQLDLALQEAAPAVVRATATDRQALGLRFATNSDGAALAKLLVARTPDFQANLLAQRYLTVVERETYVRHNVRTLRSFYRPGQLWRMLVRYLYEHQYLRFSRVNDTLSFVRRSTWFDDDFVVPGVVSVDRLHALVAAVSAWCDSFAVDETKFRPVTARERVD